MPQAVFLNGAYAEKIPLWHTDDSPWKARLILRMLARNGLSPRTIGEVGCGTGEVLRRLQTQLDPQCIFTGYDIAPKAIELSCSRQNDRLHCHLRDIRDEPCAHFDLLLVLDVLEHQENYFSFLRDVKPLAPYKIFHTVLDLSSWAVLRRNGLTERRTRYDDLHYFTKDVVLQALGGEDYQVVDWFYAARAWYRASGVKGRIQQLPRVLGFSICPDLTVRTLGGYSLFVLAR